MPTGRLRNLPTSELVSMAVLHLLEAMDTPFPSERQLELSRSLSRELRRRQDGLPAHELSCVCEDCTDFTYARWLESLFD